jgi:hypothetical protein
MYGATLFKLILLTYVCVFRKVVCPPSGETSSLSLGGFKDYGKSCNSQWIISHKLHRKRRKASVSESQIVAKYSW